MENDIIKWGKKVLDLSSNMCIKEIVVRNVVLVVIMSERDSGFSSR